jgi:hypothetical protein
MERAKSRYHSWRCWQMYTVSRRSGLGWPTCTFSTVRKSGIGTVSTGGS